MSLLRLLQRIHRSRRLAGAGRLAAVTLLLAAGFAQPGTAPVVMAAAAAVVPLAPQTCSTLVANLFDNGTPHTLRSAVACATAGQTVTFSSSLAGQTISLPLGEILIDQSLTIDGSGSSHYPWEIIHRH